MSAIPILDSIAEVGAHRRAWLVDVWGVVHNGVAPFASSISALQTYRAQGGFVVLVTNAPRPSPSVVQQLDRIGVPRDAYDAMVTSGDVTRGLLSAWRDKRIHHVGPDRDLPLFEGLGIDFVTSIEAEIVVCTGLEDDERETPDLYQRLLDRFRRGNVVMICANPDVTVERGDKIVYCAGALGEAYEAIGGEVVYAGKPHIPIYELASGIIAKATGEAPPNETLLAIGDGVHTDIAGASAAGIDSVFIRSGISIAAEDMSPEAVSALFAERAERPLGAMTALTW